MASKHISLLWSAKGVIMGHVGDMAFLPGQKIHITWSHCLCKKPISPHLENSVVLPLTPHTISNRQTCQKEKCMINRLLYGNFHIIPHINPRPISAISPRADMGVSGWYGVWYENCHVIISIYDRLLHFGICFILWNSLALMGMSCYLNVNVKKADILDTAILTSDKLKLLKIISVRKKANWP